ncbi:MAG TPA: Ku protein [Candidatus Dormibacteraeota bacterium]|nr:Ku protein [Candidatus Dormibacteraeota bacterium]
MATSVWKGYLTFGLLSIPIRLFSAARGERIGLNQLHEPCHSRIKMPLFCPTCNRMVERSEIVKGYEYEKDQYVLFSEEDLDKIEPESARTMEILEFVKIEEIDPLYYDASYYMTPEDEGKKAYQLLLKAMEDSEYAAIAKVTMHQREHIVVIRPRAEGLTLHTMFYQSEIREVTEYGRRDNTVPKEQEKKLAMQLIESLAANFEPAKYRDEYQEGMKALIAAKQKGQEVAEAPRPQRAPVIDLMEALKKSINAKQAAGAATPKKPLVRAVPPAAQKRTGKKATG